MPDHIVLLSDAESRRLATGTLFVVRPVVPQPEYVSLYEGLEWPGRKDDCWTPTWEPPSVADFAAFAKKLSKHNPLGVPGDTLVGKERHCFVAGPVAVCAGIAYGADNGAKPHWLEGSAPELEGQTVYNIANPEAWRWRPASAMPLWAVRHRPVVKEAGVMRVGDVTSADMEGIGLDIAKIVLSYGEPDGVLESVVAETNARNFAAYWNRRWPKYPYEQSPWVWFARVEEEHHA